MTTHTSAPVPAEVGLLYDKFDDTETLHFGYWETPEPDDSLEQAAPRLTDQVIARLGVRPGQRVLDAGCGIGEPAIRVAQRTGAEIVGVTVSQEQVKRATALAEREGVADRVTFVHGDAMDLPFEPDSFDAAYALESIIHMDRARALREFARVVRPGGAVVCTDLFRRAPRPVDRPSVIDQLAALWLLSEPVLIGDYGPLVLDAGLRLREVKDITPQVFDRALTKFAERIRNQDHTSIPEEIITRLQVEQQLQLAQFMDDLVASDELGYSLFAADLAG
jgi:ubiquinone/menaquinone biosynthesis C-methylase UbiE